jgi:signal transduction histidine kinase
MAAMHRGSRARPSTVREALRRSTAHLEITSALLGAVIEQMADGVFAETSTRSILLINQACCKLFEIESTPSALVGQPTRTVSAALAEVVGDAAFLDQAMDAPDRRTYERRLPNGVAVECSYMPVNLDAGSVTHVWQFHDVTERRESEAELHASRQRLRELTAHLETVREEERRSLAQTLHDEVGQTLTSVRLELAGAIDEIRKAAGAPSLGAIDRLQSAVGLVDVSLDSVRRVSTALRPPILDQFGVVSAVRWEAAVFEKRTGIRCRVHAVPQRIELPPAHVTVLYRILVEALTNVARHAHAGAVQIRLRKRNGVVLMDVRDNGRGITEHETANPRTMGLLGMRERALTLGGDVRVTGARGGGTSVLVILPLEREEAAASE